MSLAVEARNLLDNLADLLEKKDFDIEWDGEILNISKDPKNVWVIYFHNYTNQIWLASPVSGARHFCYQGSIGWECTKNGELLQTLFEKEFVI
jgi:frataxin-like iron-binding protein CyaY